MKGTFYNMPPLILVDRLDFLFIPIFNRPSIMGAVNIFSYMTIIYEDK